MTLIDAVVVALLLLVVVPLVLPPIVIALMATVKRLFRLGVWLHYLWHRYLDWWVRTLGVEP